MKTYEVKFALNDKVECDDVKMMITGITIRKRGYLYECSWMSNSEHKVSWFEEDELRSMP
jgi:uncharacterized protein YodC (DUF2158 family)